MNIFLTGAAGYVGGTVANRLQAAGHHVRGLVRTTERAEQVAALGIEPVMGDLSDLDLLRSCAQQADAVVSAANADDSASVDAMLEGLVGTDKVFVHTSGSGVVADCAGGAASSRIYEDDTPIDAKPLRLGRAALNASIVAASSKGIRTIVIAPPMIYGEGLGVNKDSIQIPALVGHARNGGVAQYIGPGANRWSNVHVVDLADLYLLAVQQAPKAFYCYAENGENSMLEIAASIAAMLQQSAPQSLSLEQAVAMFGEVPATYSFGSNSRVRAVKAREVLNWKPSRPSLLDEIESGSYSRAIA